MPIISSVGDFLASVWNQFTLLVDKSPRSIFAGLLAILAGLAGVAIISLFSRLRSVKSRNRQLQENVDALSVRLEETRADLDAKISALSVERTREAPIPVPKNEKRELPVALMREELASLQLDMRAPEECAEAPVAEEKT